MECATGMRATVCASTQEMDERGVDAATNPKISRPKVPGRKCCCVWEMWWGLSATNVRCENSVPCIARAAQEKSHYLPPIEDD